MPTETEVCNIGIIKIGGAGDQESGTGLIASINGTDRVSVRCKELFPRIRRRVFGDMAKAEAPPKEALIFTDLGAETEPGIKMGGWDYAFNVPKNTIVVTRQIEEVFSTTKASIIDKVVEYPFQIRWEGATMILFTNHLSNSDNDSAFIERVFDQKNTGTWSETTIDAIATLLASELVQGIGAVNAERVRLLAEYKTVALPAAIAFNQAVDDPYKRTIKDYLGGRNQSLDSV
jgi:hypothetical protein